MDKIYGGAFQLARKMFSSEVWLEKPSSWKIIWVYILGKVAHKDNSRFKRGEGYFNFSQEKRNIGIDITPDMIKKFLRYARGMTMISTKRSTRGTIIKVLNYAKYQTLSNFSSTSQSTSKAREKHERSTTIYKNDKNVKNDNNPKGLQDNPKGLQMVYGNPFINEIIDYLASKIGGSLDESIKKNRQYAQLLLKRMEKESDNPVEVIKQLIDSGLSDSFHARNLTSMQYLFYNAQKIKQAYLTKPKTLNL